MTELEKNREEAVRHLKLANGHLQKMAKSEGTHHYTANYFLIIFKGIVKIEKLIKLLTS